MNRFYKIFVFWQFWIQKGAILRNFEQNIFLKNLHSHFNWIFDTSGQVQFLKNLRNRFRTVWTQYFSLKLGLATLMCLLNPNFMQVFGKN